MPYRIDPKTGRKVPVDATTGQPIVMSQPAGGAGAPAPVQGQGFLASLLQPFKKTGSNIAGLGVELGRMGVNAIKPEAAGFDNPFIDEQKLDTGATGIEALKRMFNLSDQRGAGARGELADQTRASAGVASWAVPFGKTGRVAEAATSMGLKPGVAEALSKWILPSATSGALSAASQKGAGVDDIAKGAAYGVGTAGVLKGAGGLLTKAKQGVGNIATKATNKATPSQFSTAVNNLGYDLNELTRKYFPKAQSYDDVLGEVAARGEGGILKTELDTAEKVIQDTVKATKGSTIKLSGDDILSSLKSELKALKSSIGEGSRVESLKSIIKEVEKKYKNGVSVSSALDTVRRANSKFGKTVANATEKEAVISASQKIEANAIRATLKKMFPEMADALTTQSEILTLRPVLSQARGKLSTQGSTSTIGGFSANPFTGFGIPQQILQKPQVSSRLQNAGRGESSNLREFFKPLLEKAPAVVGGSIVSPQTPEGAPSATNTTMPGYEPIDPEFDTAFSEVASSSDQATQKIVSKQPQANEIGQLIGLAMLEDIQKTGGKHISELKIIKEMIDSGQSGLDLPSSTANQIADFDAAASQLGALGEQLSSLKVQGFFGPVKGRLNSINEYNIDAQSLQSLINATRQSVGKALEGGVLRKEDEDKYKKILPTLADKPEVALQKIQQVQAMLQRSRQARIDVYQGNNVSNGLNDIMATQTQE